jgi:hypothetical protein
MEKRAPSLSFQLFETKSRNNLAELVSETISFLSSMFINYFIEVIVFLSILYNVQCDNG